VYPVDKTVGYVCWHSLYLSSVCMVYVYCATINLLRCVLVLLVTLTLLHILFTTAHPLKRTTRLLCPYLVSNYSYVIVCPLTDPLIGRKG